MAVLTTFANATGSIPLIQLDNNLANLNSNTTFAITASNVSGNIQANITQLGNLVNLNVDGNVLSNNVVGNLGLFGNAIVVGNLVVANLTTNNSITVSGLTVTNTAAVGESFSANSVSANALLVQGSTSTGNLTANGISFVSVNTVTNNSANANVQLSTSTSYNLIINTANSNIAIVPPLGAVDGQITSWTIGGNANTILSAFSGVWVPSFDGVSPPGTAHKYVSSGNTWYKLA